MIPCTELPARLEKLKARGVRVFAVNRIRKGIATFYTLETDEALGSPALPPSGPPAAPQD